MITLICGGPGGGKTMAAFSGAITKAKLGSNVVYYSDSPGNYSIYGDLPRNLATVIIHERIKTRKEIEAMIPREANLVVFDLSFSFRDQNENMQEVLEKISKKTGKEIWMTIQLSREVRKRNLERI